MYLLTLLLERYLYICCPKLVVYLLPLLFWSVIFAAFILDFRAMYLLSLDRGSIFAVFLLYG